MPKAIFGAGCFWGVEKKFSEVKGVIETEVGYSQGKSSKTSYEEVCSGNTDHVEVVMVTFDDQIISYENLIDFFYQIHDPTTLNQQGPDKGTQYRSAIFYVNDSQKEIATSVIGNIKGAVTEITELDVFYPAEGYHQNYFNDNLNQPYCRMVILPKIQKYFRD